MTPNLSENAQLATRAVILQGERDFAGLRAISDPDVVLEFPFHPNGPAEFHGIDAMIEQFGVLAAFQTLEITPIDVFDTGGEVVIVPSFCPRRPAAGNETGSGKRSGRGRAAPSPADPRRWQSPIRAPDRG